MLYLTIHLCALNIHNASPAVSMACGIKKVTLTSETRQLLQERGTSEITEENTTRKYYCRFVRIYLGGSRKVNNG